MVKAILSLLITLVRLNLLSSRLKLCSNTEQRLAGYGVIDYTRELWLHEELGRCHTLHRTLWN